MIEVFLKNLKYYRKEHLTCKQRECTMSTTAPHDSLYSTEFFNYFEFLIEEVAKWS
jgi:hypothetical protein